MLTCKTRRTCSMFYSCTLWVSLKQVCFAFSFRQLMFFNSSLLEQQFLLHFEHYFFFMANSTHHNTIKFWKEGPPCLRKPLLNKSPNSLHKNYHSVQPPKLVVKIPQLNHLSKYTVCPRGLIIGNCPQIQNKQSKNVTVIHNFFYLCSNFQLTQSIL